MAKLRKQKILDMKLTGAFFFYIFGLLALSCAILIVSCTHSPVQLSGGGSDTEISGRIIASNGTGKAGVVVSLIDESYNPAYDGALPADRIDTTDSTGRYQFDSLSSGVYNILAVQYDDDNKILINSIVVDTGKSEVPAEFLKKTATVLLVPPDSMLGKTGYVSAPGTMFCKAFNGSAQTVVFDSVPQGIFKKIVFQKTKIDGAMVLFSNVIIDTSDTMMLYQKSSWSHFADITLNTTQSGAGVTGNVIDFPVLVRLNSANFDFSQAKQNGEDLRFVKKNNSALAFEIEYWDSATASASIWVKLDTVYGNNSSQYFKMLWGNSNASAISAPSVVFDTSDGFVGVWHLGESGGTTQMDATYNLFNGTPVEAMTGSSDIIGIIGRAQNFDGSSQWIEVLNARNSSLDVQTDSFYTVSAWAYVHTLDSNLHVLLSKGSAQYGIMINERNQWVFFGGLAGYGVDTTTAASASVNVWTHIAGVRKGMKQYLYINGVAVDSTVSAKGGSAVLSNNFYDLVIGRQSDNQSLEYDGVIDETRVLKRAQNADWVKLCYMNQKDDQSIVQVLKKH